MKLTLSFLVLVAVVSIVVARNPGQFTPPGCGPNSRMDTCSKGCIPTCQDNDTDNCIPRESCVEECVCFKDYVKSPDNNGCIQRSECENFTF